MDNQALIDKYNPMNAKALLPEEVTAMQNLTDEEIKVLAKAYPNPAIQKTYLILYDKNKNAKNQLYSRSTWPNLNSLRMIGQKQFVAYTFHVLFNAAMKGGELKAGPVQDLTEDELNKAPGLKIGGQQTVEESPKSSHVPGADDEDDFEDLTDEAAKKTGDNKVVESKIPVMKPVQKPGQQKAAQKQGQQPKKKK